MVNEIALGWIWLLADKILGPLFKGMGDDLAIFYKKNRDKLVEYTASKIENLLDWKKANLRVADEVFNRWIKTDNDICLEYFSWILAGSRSEDGSDDTWIYFLDIINWLSSQHLKLHFQIYHNINNYLQEKKISLNRFLDSEVKRISIYFLLSDMNILDLPLYANWIHTKSLIGLRWSWYSQHLKKFLPTWDTLDIYNTPIAWFQPTTGWYLLYMAVMNNLENKNYNPVISIIQPIVIKVDNII